MPDALCSVSSYSRAGTEPAVMPLPTEKWSVSPYWNIVRMAMLKAASPLASK